ncbi:hypothetical protein HZB88_04280 [archaeon]|nr:hypothetical protein [archaeon]
MPHQCVRCGKVYPTGCRELLEGCSCGGRFFFFVRNEAMLKKAEKVTANLSIEEKQEMEKDVLDIVGGQIEEDKPVILDFESIKIEEPGKYEIDLVDLFRGKPLVYKLAEGKYIIDIISTFEAKDKTLKEKGETVLDKIGEDESNDEDEGKGQLDE